MEAQTRRVLISGYYGFQNSGDEAVLHSILYALKEQESDSLRVIPVVLSNDPAETTRLYGVEAIPRMNPKALWKAMKQSDGLISGGGSLLQDVTGWKTIPYYLMIMRLAKWLKKPVFIYSQGIGPVGRPLFQKQIRNAFNKADYISVRDPASAQLLEQFGVRRDIEIVPDPVMGMPLMKEQVVTEENIDDRSLKADSGSYTIGISVRYWNEDRSELEQLAQSMFELQKRVPQPLQYRFLPFHLPSDERASEYVRDAYYRICQAQDVKAREVEMFHGSEHPEEMVRQVAACQLVIGMRLHALIYAASQHVPMAGISYDPKIGHFLSQIDMAPFARTDAFDAGQFAGNSADLLRSQGDWKHKRKPVLEELREKSRQPAKQIYHFFRLMK
ncbi:polysaccharide pyruvyl transferase CsaB [Marinicrinis sediminis]|uniref:Polysaccharide pyruvyl transferase CsaB n=1 Tax=Marinicrinis sediminis TaxID=1652465 RepID=A0ABW5RBR7_9BACL